MLGARFSLRRPSLIICVCDKNDKPGTNFCRINGVSVFRRFSRPPSVSPHLRTSSGQVRKIPEARSTRTAWSSPTTPTQISPGPWTTDTTATKMSLVNILRNLDFPSEEIRSSDVEPGYIGNQNINKNDNSRLRTSCLLNNDAHRYSKNTS